MKLVNSYLIDSPQPSNINFFWNFGSLLASCLVIQIITGVTLAMHYNANVLEAFNSVEHIMRDVNNGWLLRYLHSNTASAFFFIVYLHIGRGLYYGSYKAPRTLVWIIGAVILILMMATAFLGFSNSPRWYKLNKSKEINNNISNVELWKKVKYKQVTKLTIDLNTSFLGKANVRRFSTIYRSLSIKPKELGLLVKHGMNFTCHVSQAKEYSKDVLDFLSRNKLKPDASQHIYESLNEKSTQNKVLNETRNIALPPGGKCIFNFE